MVKLPVTGTCNLRLQSLVNQIIECVAACVESARSDRSVQRYNNNNLPTIIEISLQTNFNIDLAQFCICVSVQHGKLPIREGA